MNEIIVMLILDSLMIGLLVATVYYCFRLNTRVKVLQDSKSEFSQLIERFDATTQRAQQSIEDLQNISKKVNEQLAGRLDKANFLADDLAFMIEKGTKLADKMEDRVTQRGAERTAVATRPEAKMTAAPNVEKRGAASGPTLRERMGKTEAEQSAEQRKKASLESVLNRVAQKEDEGPALPGQKRRPGNTTARLRSKAEQELYDALKSGNS